MEFLEYINPDMLLIVPVLWVFGWILKQASFIADKLIPLILGGTGILLAVCWVFGAEEAVNGTAVFTALTQGILCAGAAVYGNQIVKQLFKKDGKDDGEQ